MAGLRHRRGDPGAGPAARCWSRSTAGRGRGPGRCSVATQRSRRPSPTTATRHPPGSPAPDARRRRCGCAGPDGPPSPASRWSGAAGGVTPQTAVLRAGRQVRVVAAGVRLRGGAVLAHRGTCGSPSVGRRGAWANRWRSARSGSRAWRGWPPPRSSTRGPGRSAGSGPQVRVDDEVHDTAVSGTHRRRPARPAADLVGVRRPGRARRGPTPDRGGAHPPVPAGHARLAAGRRHRDPRRRTPAARGRRSVESWGPVRREVEVGAGTRVRAARRRERQRRVGGDARRSPARPGDHRRLAAGLPGARGRRRHGRRWCSRPTAPTASRCWSVALLALFLVARCPDRVVGAERRRPVAGRGAGGPGRADPGPGGARDRRPGRGVRAATGAALLVLGGPVAAAALVVAARRARGAWALPVGGALVAISALASALSSGLSAGRPGVAADLTAAAGVGLLAGSVLFEGDRAPVRPVLPGRAAVRARLAARPRVGAAATTSCCWACCSWRGRRCCAPSSSRAPTSGRTTSSTSTSPTPSA